MGGLANRGTTTGNVTGGGGRSVMPNRDYLNRLAAIRRQIEMARRRPTGGGYGGIGYAPPEELPRVPPGGGYSGGVIPRFQQGRALTPRAVKRAWGYSRAGNPAVLLPSMYPDARARSIAKVQAGEIPHFGPSSGGSWGQPPGGGYSGGVIPRFQSGRTMNPRAAGEEAMKRQRRMQWNARTTAGGPAGWGPYGSPFGPNARFPSPPGGWQAGGQFPEAAFPVESELADESPWYPDEEVGYEEAVPMQGGFDVFGRSGG